jgi:hypothetical protein
MWLGHNSRQLGALIISSSTKARSVALIGSRANNKKINKVLAALTDAAAAAVAAGRPLPLHTLRVLGPGPDLRLTGRLLAALPNLTCLQLMAGWSVESMHARPSAISEHMAPLQQAMQLQELYLTGPLSSSNWDHQVPQLLPANLKRLGCTGSGLRVLEPVPDLSHLTRVTFLQLKGWRGQDIPFSAHLPPGLQQLQLRNMIIMPSHLHQDKEILTGCRGLWNSEEQLPVQSSYTTLRFLTSVSAGDLAQPHVVTALQQLVKLTGLGVVGSSAGDDLPPAMSAAAGLQGLRSLHLRIPHLQQTPGHLAALTQLTSLRLSLCSGSSGGLRNSAWAAELGRMSWLRWLSVPAVLLVGEQAWLGGLQQLQVLVLGSGEGVTQQMLSRVVQWLGECAPQQLPPRLLLLGLAGTAALQAVPWDVRRRLQQRLGSSGCEVVVGVSLNEVCDPVKQLAGLPVRLQQALR